MPYIRLLLYMTYKYFLTCNCPLKRSFLPSQLKTCLFNAAKSDVLILFMFLFFQSNMHFCRNSNEAFIYSICTNDLLQINAKPKL